MASIHLDLPHGPAAGEDDLARRLARSAACLPRPAGALTSWLAQRRRRNPFEVVQVPFDELDGWRFAPGTDDLVHHSGRFFSVVGLHVQTDYGPVGQWWQPIIDQPDGAILGILVKELDGVLHFLLQAKMEPGNLNVVQLSPTVQATSSNYLRAHKGGRSRYLEFFTDPGRSRVLLDVLQSEQGSWFRGKRNRNMLLEVTGDVPAHEDFVWLTLGEILALLRHPHLINMDARTVLSGLPLPRVDEAAGDGFVTALRRSALAGARGSVHPWTRVRSWLTDRKAAYALATRQVPLNSVSGWRRDRLEISHRDGRYFRILGVRVHATNREVRSWCQPLLAPRGQGLVAFVVRRVGGVLHLLARADLRPGYRDVVELGPSVQCTPTNMDHLPPDQRPALLDLVRSGDVVVRYDVEQSEEGGRFYHARTRHLVVEVGEDLAGDWGPDFCWLTVAQLAALARTSYQVNIEARSLLLCLRSLL